MTKKTDQDIIINGSEGTFQIAEIDTLTRTTYMGSFAVKCFLNPIETIKADRLYRELIGPTNSVMASSQAQSYAFAISQLAVRVIKNPDFFNNPQHPDLPGGHLPEDILIKILDRAIDAEGLFRDQQTKKFEDTQKRLLAKFKTNKIKKRASDDPEDMVPEDDEGEEEN